ncbi:MAG: hypothetical protein E6G95_09685 [Alphaproteobacteria bacterium]|nr:MAG: hypothetical protein E6G95_09685 [Alphaproteobacteria bacterium]
MAFGELHAGEAGGLDPARQSGHVVPGRGPGHHVEFHGSLPPPSRPCHARDRWVKFTAGATEADMSQETSARRDVLKGMAAAGATGLAAGTLAQGAAHAAGAPAYNPDARFELAVNEVEVRRNAAGRMLMARIYQPQGTGPFPTVIDLHGGAWNRKDRLAEQPMDRALAASGLLVVAVDLTLAPEARYPACVQDANYAVRWLKANAARWKGDVSRLGVYGSSSGGHVAELLAMRPRDPRYAAIALAAAPDVDATVAYVALRSPVSNTFARYQNAERRRNEGMMENNKVFFSPWETIHEGNRAGRARRQRPAGGAGEVRRHLPGGGRRVRLSPVRKLGSRMGRRTRAANRQGARGGQAIHRAAAEGLSHAGSALAGAGREVRRGRRAAAPGRTGGAGRARSAPDRSGALRRRGSARPSPRPWQGH